MPASIRSTEVEFSAVVPRALYDEFKRLLPYYGVNTWFINTALEEFLKLLREEPIMEFKVQQAVGKMMEERKGKTA